MPKLILFLTTEVPSASPMVPSASPMGDSSLLHSAPLYCQPMGLTAWS